MLWSIIRDYNIIAEIIDQTIKFDSLLKNFFDQEKKYMYTPIYYNTLKKTGLKFKLKPHSCLFVF